MKKNYFYLLLSFFAFFGFNQSAWAQTTTIADGLIKVSDATNEYWYYIENGHAHDVSGTPNTSYVNDKDGRFGTLLSEAPDGIIRVELVKPTTKRAVQKWKVVQSETDGYYCLVNQKGNYFHAISGENTCKVSSTAMPETGTCNIDISLVYGTVENSGLYVKMQAQNIDNYIGAFNVNSGSGTQFAAIPEITKTPINTDGVHGNPRSWRFVPENDIDTYYPEIYETATASDKVYKWYYIKSLDTAIQGDAKYMTETGLAAKENAQLFGFVHESYFAGKTNDYSCTDFTQIILKETGKALTVGSTNKWAMRHYYSASYDAGDGTWTPEIQAVFRTMKGGGSILNNSLNLTTDGTSGKALNIFNSAYNWAFELASFSVAVNGGENVQILTQGIPTIVESGTPLEIKFKVGPAVSDGFTYSPVVTVNGGDPLPATLPDSEGVYTLSLIVAGNTDISIAAQKAQNEITFDVTGATGVTITSPELTAGKYTTGNILTVEYTLEAGYTVPNIAANDGAVTVGTPALSSGKYTVAVSNISKATTLTFTNAVITYNVTLPESVNGITVGTNAEEANYFDDYTFTFTVTEGYNHPQVYANGAYVSSAKNEDGSYTATISDVRADLTITASAFELAENVLPVVADTYITGTAYTDYSGVNYSAGDVLWIQGSKGSYNRISYLEFDLSAFGEAQYNTAYLKLIYKERQPNKYEDPIFHVRTVPAEMPAINVVTWKNSGEADGLTRKGDVISDFVAFDRTSEAETVLELDVTTYALGNLGASNTVRLAATSIATTKEETGATDPEAGYFAFYSREGALAASNIDYIPALIFEKRPEVTVNVAESCVAITSPAGTSPYVVKTGDDFVLEFALADGFKDLVVTIGGAPATAEQLVLTDGTYTLTLTGVNADVVVEISATGNGTGFDTASQAKVNVYTEGSNLIVKSAQAAVCEVYSVSGQLVAKQTVNGESSIALNKGIYLVKVTDQVYKVNLK